MQGKTLLYTDNVNMAHGLLYLPLHGHSLELEVNDRSRNLTTIIIDGIRLALVCRHFETSSE